MEKRWVGVGLMEEKLVGLMEKRWVGAGLTEENRMYTHTDSLILKLSK